jgi:hypothetical protein
LIPLCVKTILLSKFASGLLPTISIVPTKTPRANPSTSMPNRATIRASFPASILFRPASI